MKDRKYVIFLIALIAFYVVYEMQKPIKVNWLATYHEAHKIPFGGFAMHDLMSGVFYDDPLKSEFRTLYELYEEDEKIDNPLIIADGVALDQNDFGALLKHIQSGGTAMISARDIQGVLADSLGFSIALKDKELAYDFRAIQEALSGEAKEPITLNLTAEESKTYQFSKIATTSYFSRFRNENFDVLALNSEDAPVLLRYNQLPGNLYISTMPLAFTNYFIVDEETSEFAAALLSVFPKNEVFIHNEYYQLGRKEPQTPLRVVLSNPSLKWAFFILLFTVITFMVFEAKRRQRIIPLITPLKNMSIEFVETLGRLYYRQSDHRKLAEKRILFWKDYVRGHYNLKTDNFDKSFEETLSKKSGESIKSIRVLLEFIKRIETGEVINEFELMKIEKQLNAFYGIE